MPITPLTPHEREAVCDLADTLFRISLEISENPDLQCLMDGENTAYTDVNHALSLLFRQLGIAPGDIRAILDVMGDGSPADEAIETVRNEKENQS